MAGKIVVFLGPMFSGKTSKLFEKFSKERGTIAVKPIIDTRSPRDRIISHNKMQIPAYSVDLLSDIERVFTLQPGQRLLVDEGQFFKDLATTCDRFANMGVNVYVAALNGTSEQKPWPSVSELLPKADKIIHLCTIKCQKCFDRPAPFTVLKKAVDVPKKKGDILIGAQETYEPVCRRCL